MASFLPDDIADVPAFTNQPSWSQPEEAAELFNPIGFMDNNEEVRQSKNDDDAAKHVAAEKESKAKKTKKRADYRSDPCCWCGDR